MAKITFTVMALLSLIDPTRAVQIKQLTEESRYFGSDGKPINLADASAGIARIELTKTLTSRPPEQTLLMYEESTGCEVTDASLLQVLAENDIKVDDVTNCAMNSDGNPMKVRLALAKRTKGMFIADFFVGNPPQKLRGVFDTGSSNTWILNANTPLEDNPKKKFSFHQDQSSTFKETDQTAEIWFGGGELSGNFIIDDMRLGDCEAASGNLIQIRDQKLGNIKKTNLFAHEGSTAFEAIVGMAYPELAEPGATPFFDNMMKQNLLASNLFAFFMVDPERDDQLAKTELTLGYYDKSKFVGDIDWHDVKLKYSYGIKLDDIKVNGKALNVCQKLDDPEQCLVTVDSGTNDFGVPSKAISAFQHANIPVANFLNECQDRSQIGSLTYVIDGKDYTFNADEWLTYEEEESFAQRESIDFSDELLGPQLRMKPVEDVNYVQIAAETNANKLGPKKFCGARIMKLDIEADMFLVGDLFMRKFYSIFDRENDRVGLARSIAKTSDMPEATLSQKTQK